MRRMLLAFAVLCLLFPSVASAQIPGLIMSPTAIEFDPSPNHNDTLPLSGAPVVTDYKAYYFLNSVTNPVKGQEALLVPLGKPAVNAAGKLVAVNVFGGLVANTAYKAVVVANGSGGESPFSNVSVPFGKEALVVPGKVPGTPVPR